MKKKIFVKSAFVGILALGMVSCADDLNQNPIDPKSSKTYNATELLAKQYATLGLTGQTGPAGKGDISNDEGESGFYRTTFNLEELCSDETIWAWQNDNDIPAITNIAWTSASDRVNWAYQRLAYDIQLYNFYLSETEGQKDDANVKSYRAEVRFLRALHYWYYLDLFRKAPFKTEYNPATLPVEKAGKDLYDWIDQELTEIEPELASIGSFNNAENFGRADQGAAYMLHARLALNSAVYTNGQVKDYQKAIDYCDKVIGSGKYALSTETKNGWSGYKQLFMGDNDKNEQAMKEIIFPIRQDDLKAEAYATSTYLVSSTATSGMPYLGTSNQWSCNFARYSCLQFFFNEPEKIKLATADLHDKYVKDYTAANGKAPGSSEADIIAEDKALGTSTADVVKLAGDDRALFYPGVGGGYRKLTANQITGFLSGLSFAKWTNVYSNGGTPSDATFSDTDVPLFRLAEAFLTRAEAEWRLNGSDAKAVADINALRTRAHAPQVTSVDADLLIKEWGKEFFMEGRRRSDLVRFGLFTGNKYIWAFKGGVAKGASVDKHYNVYPIPAKDISNNPGLTQNAGY